MMKRGILAGLLALLPTVASAGPIVIGGTLYNAQLAVDERVTLVPGEVAIVGAQIRNTGPNVITFQTWDPTLSTGGYGWNFGLDGWAIGFNMLNATGNDIHLAEGDTGNVFLTKFLSDPDFSKLSGVSIAPGQSLSFGLFSFRVPTGLGPNTSGVVSVGGLQLATQNSGWQTPAYNITWVLGSQAVSSNRTDLTMGNFMGTPSPGGGNRPAGVPEPSTLLSLLGAAGWCAVRVRRA